MFELIFRAVLGESNVMLSRQSTTSNMDPWKWCMNSGSSVAMFDCWREWPFADMSPYNSYTSDLATSTHNSVKQTKTQTGYHHEPAIHQCSQQLSRDWYSAYPAPQCITAFFCWLSTAVSTESQRPLTLFVAPVGKAFAFFVLGRSLGVPWIPWVGKHIRYQMSWTNTLACG